MSEQKHSDPKTLALAHERSMTLTDHRLIIANADGEMELEILLTGEGPVVRVRAAELAIESSGRVSVDCERFEVHAREAIRLASDGDLEASVAGDATLKAAGHALWEGRSVRVRASRGEAHIDASDDVRVDGGRILLNS